MGLELTEQFVFPQEALADIQERGGLKLRSQVNGVAQYDVGEHDKGIPYVFFVHQAKNEVASQQFDMEINDDVEMVRWVVVPRKHEPVCRVTDLPKELLRFRKVNAGINIDKQMIMKYYRDENGDMECTGGLYKDAYLRWKMGQKAPGMPLDKWGKLTGSEIRTLVSEGIFSVHQFAAIPEARIQERFPKVFWDRHRDAIHFVNAENAPVSVNQMKEYAEKIVEAKQENAKLSQIITDLSDRLSQLEKGGAKKASRPKKKEIHQ